MAKETYKITIVNAENGEVIERDMTADEAAAYEADMAIIAEEKAAKEAAREATIAKLAALGLTPEDLAAL